MNKNYPIYFICFALLTLFLAALMTLAANSLFFSTRTLPLEISQKMDSYLKENQFQGAALIAKGGEILFCRGYGLANEDYQIPNSPQTVFRIGSLTKQFTAVAILQLQEKGMLNVHDSIKKYLPNYPQGEKITIHHLLSHSAGIPNITEFPNLSEIQRHPSTPQHVMTYFEHLPLKFNPGTDCEYSDSGYIVLGAIIEAITKQPYEEYLKENIFHPLAMHSTYYEHPHLIIPHRASGYIQKENGPRQQAAYINMSFPHGAGALTSTVNDLYQWDRALTTPSLLTQESLHSLFTIQASSANHQITYGYGFRIGPQNREMEKCHPSIIGHFGGIEGFSAASVRYLEGDLTIILLSNTENTPLRLFQKELAHLISPSWR